MLICSRNGFPHLKWVKLMGGSHLTHYVWWVVSSFFIRLRGTRRAIPLALCMQILAEGAVSSLQHAGCHLALKSEALHRRLHISNPPHVTTTLFSVPCLLLCVIYIGMLLFGVTAGSLRALIQQDCLQSDSCLLRYRLHQRQVLADL